MAAAKQQQSKAELQPARLRLMRTGGGVHVEGSLTQMLETKGTGQHRGWSFDMGPYGVVCTKQGSQPFLVPWSQVQQVDLEEPES